MFVSAGIIMRHELTDQFTKRAACQPVRPSLSFTDAGLVLGADTVLLRLDAEGVIAIGDDAAEDRFVALLAVVGDGRLAKDCRSTPVCRPTI